MVQMSCVLYSVTWYYHIWDLNPFYLFSQSPQWLKEFAGFSFCLHDILCFNIFTMLCHGMKNQAISDSGDDLLTAEYLHINGLVQERFNSSVLAMGLRLSCTNPSIWCHLQRTLYTPIS